MKKKSKIERKKATQKRNRIIKRVLLAILVILLVVAITFASLFFYYRNEGKNSIKPNLADNTEYHEQIEYNGHLYQYNEDVVSFAFIGVDQRDMEEASKADFVGANDTNIVVAINTVSGTAAMIAIPRETVVDIDIFQNGEYLGIEKERLALAYSYGDGKEKSCQNTVDAISRIMQSVPIEKYYALDLDGIAPINDSIGGVIVKSSVDIPQHDIEAGKVVTLKGDMAESYVRTRSMTDINGSIDRVGRQVQYLESFASQTIPATIINFSTVADLYNTGAQYSQTNMTLSEVTYLASLLRSKGTNHFDTITLEGEMNVEQDSAGEGYMHALFTPDEDFLMQTILDTFYLRIK